MKEIQLGLFGDSDDSKKQITHRKNLSWREKYNLVISSPRWRKLRTRLIEKSGQKCGRCGWEKQKWDKSRTLDLHHRTYERLGQEQDSDLEVVCSCCHTKADIERTIKNRELSEQRGRRALENARFDGWASKVFGEDYDDSDGIIYEKYIDWVERRSD